MDRLGWHRRAVASALVLSLALSPAFGGGSASAAEKTPLSERSRALHALTRAGFGPRPGDIERVAAMGAQAWLAQQLRPESIPDPDVAPRLAGYETLTMTTAELLRRYPPKQLQKRALVRSGVDAEEAQRRVRASSGRRGGRRGSGRPSAGFELGGGGGRGKRAGGRGGRSGAGGEGGFDSEPQTMRPGAKNAAMPGMGEMEEDRRPLAELAMAKLVRGVYSERQLQEVMVDFWSNHFNVFAGKGPERLLLPAYDREVVRPHALGRFEDLLAATAKSPAMLLYLDNWQSVAAQGMDAPRRARGLNENYAREIMELHTLGVDGGYTQNDVTEVARCLTGWSIRMPRPSGEAPFDATDIPADAGTFIFRSELHDRGEKMVLGTRIPAGGGIADGETVVRLLARHPSTARHIASKLARRFVADEPPAALVDRLAQRFTASDGDIRAVLAELFAAPEFWEPAAYRAKVKSPFALVVSTLRGLDAEVAPGALGLLGQLRQLGEMPFLCEPPTGYADSAADWIDAGALLARLNAVLAIVAGRVPGVDVELARFGSDAAALSAALAAELLGGDVAASTLAAIGAPDSPARDEARRLGVAGTRLGEVAAAGLLLGSPEFQRR